MPRKGNRQTLVAAPDPLVMRMLTRLSLSVVLVMLLALCASAATPAGRPLPELSVTSGFGWRSDPILHRPEFHPGIDLAAPSGTPVHATAAGRVVFVGRRGGYGRVVELAHGRRMTTLYAHLLRISVHRGQMLAAGTTLGRVGRSGRTTGPHLHYEVRIAGIAVDPRPFLTRPAGPAVATGPAIPAAGGRAAPRPAAHSG